jgi:hypothetical protein
MRVSSMLAAALLLSTLPIHAQDKKGAGDSAFYQVQFRIRDLNDPAAKSGRIYSMLTAANHKATLRIGDRVPVATGSFQPGTGGTGINPLVNTQYTYLDVGVTIECIVADIGGKLGLHGNLDISTVARHDAKTPGNPNPTVGQTRLELDTAVDPGKPTIVASIDDPVNARNLQVEATVTKVN